MEKNGVVPKKAYSSDVPPVASLYVQMRRITREMHNHFTNRTNLQRVKELYNRRGIIDASDLSNLVEARLDRMTSRKRLSKIEGMIERGEMFPALKEILK